MFLFHSKFELIQPYQDGNGRVGRFITLKQCIESNIVLTVKKCNGE
ncbi:Fic family protein [Clostridium sp.]